MILLYIFMLVECVINVAIFHVNGVKCQCQNVNKKKLSLIDNMKLMKYRRIYI